MGVTNAISSVIIVGADRRRSGGDEFFADYGLLCGGTGVGEYFRRLHCDPAHAVHVQEEALRREIET